MDTNSDRIAVAAQTGGASVDCLREQLAAAQQRAERAEQAARLAELKNLKLTLELACYKRLHYAAKREHYHGEQLELFEQDMAADLEAIGAELATLPPAAERPRRSHAGRRPLPPELPRIECRHEPAACTCGQCGGPLMLIREEVAEQLDIEPAASSCAATSGRSMPAGSARRSSPTQRRRPSSTAAWPLPAYWPG